MAVYGPQGEVEKRYFLQELKDVKTTTVEVVLRHFHRCRYWSSTAVVLLLEGLRSPWSWLTGNTVDTKIYVVQAAGA
jgi:hypothetical protein